MPSRTRQLKRDLSAPPPIPEEGIEAAVAVLRSGWLHRYGETLGDASEASLLEEEFAASIGARYAVAVNWSVWAVALFAAVMVPVLALLTLLGAPVMATSAAVALAMLGYVMWLQWFVARHALALTPGLALAFSLLVNLGALVLVALPHLLAGSGGV